MCSADLRRLGDSGASMKCCSKLFLCSRIHFRQIFHSLFHFTAYFLPIRVESLRLGLRANREAAAVGTGTCFFTSSRNFNNYILSSCFQTFGLAAANNTTGLADTVADESSLEELELELVQVSIYLIISNKSFSKVCL